MSHPASGPPTVVIPDLTVTSDNGPEPQHGVSPASAGLLSPHSKSHGRSGSLDVPNSPTPSDISNDGSSTNVPPSPTLSHQSSVHFQPQTTLALRENQPTAQSGHQSYGLLDPNNTGNTHKRKGSNATFTSSEEGTEVDHRNSELDHVKSNATSATDVASEKRDKKQEKQDKKDKKKAKKSKKGTEDEEEPAEEAQKVELAQDENIDPAPFAFKPFELASLLDPKSLESLEALGGVENLLKGLGTTEDQGLGRKQQQVERSSTMKSLGDDRPGAGGKAALRHDPEKDAKTVPAITLTDSGGKEQSPEGALAASLDDRRRVYGPNTLPVRASKSLLQLMWTALKDKVLILLSIAAVISLALGLFQDFGTPREPGEPPVDWVEGVAIMVAVAIVVIVGSVNDWQKERQFKKLNEKKDERGVKVIRGGVEQVIDIKEVVVGDIALVEPGEIVPCDGIFLSGHNVKCDESGATGESDAIKKVTYQECLDLREKLKGEGKTIDSAHTDCFIISGSKVLEGVGRYVVVAVGTKSFNGRIMMALRGGTEDTPLQLKLNALAELIAKIGSAAGLILFIALLIRFFVQLGQNHPVRTASQKGIAFVNILIISVTLIVVAVPEGLPLAVTLALAFATKRMTTEKLLVRVLSSCETMANASVVCTDKTGTLTQNDMTVVAGSVGIHGKFVRHLEENKSRTNAELGAEGEESARKHVNDFSVDQEKLGGILSPELVSLFNNAIAVNSTAFEDEDPETKETVFVGSKTETALLKFAKDMGWESFRSTRDAANVVQMIPFSSERKCMGVVVKISDGKWRVYFKGASEILAKKCVQHVVVHKNGPPSGKEVETAPIDELKEENISRTIIFYANQTLRTIALCYKDMDQWPPRGAQRNEDGDVHIDALAKDLTLIAITGIEDPLRPGVRDAVSKCHRAGVTVKMCTGDNVLTARSIAVQCGIFTKGGIIMEGPVFRKLSQPDLLEVVPRLQVLARSSPEDKQLLVETLKSIGEIVGVTGDGTNDGPALKKANVGFSMGIAGTEVAKEASDIILMDDNFASIVKAIMWGRCVNDSVRKFLQFQISTNVTAVVITFVTAVASEEESSVLSAVQLLWINIIMDTFAALALATDPATESLLDRKPDKKTAPLFSTDMYKMILFQSTYQIIVTFIFHFLGTGILDLEHNKEDDKIVKTVVFNAFVFAQIFNSVNCRRLDRKLNIFEGILSNWYFIIITLIEIVFQILIVFFTGPAFQVTPIGGREWGITIALGFGSFPVGVLCRLTPSAPFEKAFKKMGFLGRRDKVLPTENPDAEGWSGAITAVRDNLSTFANIRGGRMRSSSFVVKSRTAAFLGQHNEKPSMAMSSILTMAPTLMAGTIATGTTYNRGSLSDPAHADPSKSSAALWEGKLQIHPETAQDDPVFKRFAGDQNAAQ